MSETIEQEFNRLANNDGLISKDDFKKFLVAIGQKEADVDQIAEVGAHNIFFDEV